MRVWSPAPDGTMQRERVDNRSAAGLEVEVVERPKHRLATRAHRRCVRLTRPRCPTGFADLASQPPMRSARLAGHQHPPTEVSGLDTCRLIPTHPNRPQTC